MEKDYLEHYTDSCRMGGLAPCSAACPLNLNVRKILALAQKGEFTKAYKQYRNEAVFPGIVSQICPQFCQRGCVRAGLDDPVSLKGLEQAMAAYTKTTRPTRFNLPRRRERVAIVGAGLAGLTCGLRLGTKSYQVTIYEKEARPGGRLRDLMDEEAYLSEISLQMQYSKCEIIYGREIRSLDELDCDAVFLATGADGPDFGLSLADEQSFASQQEGVFLAGAMIGAEPVEDIAQAGVAAHSIETYLKTGKMTGVAGSFLRHESCIQKDLTRLPAQAMVQPADGTAYTPEEAAAEAGRCLLCDCDDCRAGCPLLDHYNKTPTLLAKDALVALQGGGAGIARQTSTHIASTCNLCGLCGSRCPEGIDLGRINHDFRYLRHEKGKYPAGYHDFFLRDMNFCNTEASLARLAPGTERASLLFFPGCQLGGADPRYLTDIYRYLLDRVPDTGICLGCCGAPADWAGIAELHQSVLEQIQEVWNRFGRPTLVCTCPTCMRQLGTFLPQIPTVSLYELVARYGLPDAARPSDGTCMSIFDPCASRPFPAQQQAVRTIAEQLGIPVEELEFANEQARCCGWGGHIQIANPHYARRISQDRMQAARHPYLAYCANCREVFAWGGKPSVHLLDLLFDRNGLDYTPPSWGQKRQNRLLARQAVLEQVFRESAPLPEKDGFEMNLILTPELVQKLSQNFILESEVLEAVRHTEATGNKVYNPETDSYIGYHQIGIITYWVDYQLRGEDIILRNAYSHRVAILEDEVLS